MSSSSFRWRSFNTRAEAEAYIQHDIRPDWKDKAVVEEEQGLPLPFNVVVYPEGLPTAKAEEKKQSV